MLKSRYEIELKNSKMLISWLVYHNFFMSRFFINDVKTFIKNVRHFIKYVIKKQVLLKVVFCVEILPFLRYNIVKKSE